MKLEIDTTFNLIQVMCYSVAMKVICLNFPSIFNNGSGKREKENSGIQSENRKQ